jgi:hypothetical protein
MTDSFDNVGAKNFLHHQARRAAEDFVASMDRFARGCVTEVTWSSEHLVCDRRSVAGKSDAQRESAGA